jgi:hypothetical protein
MSNRTLVHLSTSLGSVHEDKAELMTLSQIIARSAKHDEKIPDTGHFAARVEIQNGKVTYVEVTKKIK